MSGKQVQSRWEFPEWTLVERHAERYPDEDWYLVFRRKDRIVEISVSEKAWRAFGDKDQP